MSSGTSEDVADRRSAPRYPVDRRIFASIDGRTVALRNICASGIALRAIGFETGSLHTLEINLDHQHMTLGIEILAESDDSLLHARFVDGTTEVRDAIDRYVAALSVSD